MLWFNFAVLNPNNMKDFVVRLLDERSELNRKMAKLYDFIESDEAESIDKVMLGLLRVQYQLMKTYHTVLDERIDLLLK
jgi:hypothetical protein